MATVEYLYVFIGGTVATLVGYALFLVYSYLEHRKDKLEQQRVTGGRSDRVVRLLGGPTATHPSYAELRAQEDARAKERMLRGRPGQR